MQKLIEIFKAPVSVVAYSLNSMGNIYAPQVHSQSHYLVFTALGGIIVIFILCPEK